MSSRTLGYVFVVVREFPALCRAQMSGVRLSKRYVRARSPPESAKSIAY